MQEAARVNWPIIRPDAAAASIAFIERHNPELDYKVKKACDKFSESQHIVANEPSLAFFRIQEHVRKSLPVLVERKHEVEDLQESVKGSCFDAEYAVNAVRNMERSQPHFRSIQEMMKNAMFMKQQLHYEQNRREQERVKPSMYRSTMTRTQTLQHTMALLTNVDEGPQNELPQPVKPPRPKSVEAGGSPSRARSSSLTGRQHPPATVFR